MTTERLREGTQIRTSMIKEATGVALMTAMIGAKSSLTGRETEENAASRIPVVEASRNPLMILLKEKSTEIQNSPAELSEEQENMSSSSFRTTETGDTRSISCPIIRLMISQTISQKRTAHIRNVLQVSLLIFPLFTGCNKSHLREVRRPQISGSDQTESADNRTVFLSAQRLL